MTKTSDALKIIEQTIGEDLEIQDMIAEASLNAEVAQLIYEARTNAGLTQRQLAELIGVEQSLIVCLEDADYNGHSLKMLQKIAIALNKRVRIDFEPLDLEKANFEKELQVET